MNKFRKISILDNSIEFSIPYKWKVKYKSAASIEFNFPFGIYPKLGVNVECFDNPKLISKKDIDLYLTDGINNNKKPEKIAANTLTINYEIKTAEDNLILWKVLNILKPRGFRIVRLSLSWPNNTNANEIVSEVLKDIKEVINCISFSTQKTVFDDLASLEYKLKSARLEDKELWNIFKISLPKRWRLVENFSNQTAFVTLDEEKFHLFLENIKLNWNKEIISPEKTAIKLIEEMTKNIVISEQVFKKSEDNFIFYFLVNERDKENRNFCNHIWYRIKVFKNNIKIISIVLNFEDVVKSEGEIYVKYINNKISNSEIS